MSTQTQAPARPRRGQDPDVKGNPYSAVFLRARADRDEYLVESASGNDPYVTAVHHEIPDLDTCSCQAPRHCWHRWAARLRRDCDRMYQNCANTYRHCDLEACQNDEYILQRRLAEADSWLIRAQLGACGDRIAELLNGAQEVA